VETSKNKNLKGDTKMSKDEMISKIETLKEWETIIAEATAEAEAIKDSIKQEMLAQGTEELVAGTYTVRYTSVLSNRFDSTKFKQFYGDLYKEFTKQTASRRFSISA
jgi:predicted phage-related endonuclease